MMSENEDIRESSKDGRLTAEIGETLRMELEPRGYGVFHDHGTAGDYTGRIVCWYGDGEPDRKNRLSFLDIAIVDANHHALALIEIEETTDKPKTLLGDVFATLMGDHIRFSGMDHNFEIREWTTLIVMGKGSGDAEGSRYLAGKVKTVGSGLHTGNSDIDEILIDSYKDGELETKLREHVEVALAMSAIRRKFDIPGQVKEIPLQKGGAFHAKRVEGGIEVDNLGSQPFLPWEVFAEAVRLLWRLGGRAERGDAMNSRLGDPGLSLDSVEGHIAHTIYGQKIGESVFRRISPVAAILVWAGVCEHAPGELILRH